MFYPRNFDSSIAHLQTAVQQISSWMSTNILTLNSSKTEFLIIGLNFLFLQYFDTVGWVFWRL